MIDTPKNLYHYCSIESFFNIINSKSLWISDGRTMNDSKESKDIEELFIELNDDSLSGFQDSYDFNKKNSYLFCLSENGDSLNQWRSYANDAEGLCIGFNKHRLEKDLTPFKLAEGQLSLGKVIYRQKEKIKILENLKKKYINGPILDEKLELFYLYFGKNLANLAHTFKNKSFYQEEEWRVIFTPSEPQYSIYDYNSNFLASEIKYRASNNQLVRYNVLRWAKMFDSNLINEIVIGPKCGTFTELLREFLDFNNLKRTKIIKSTSSYR